MLEKFTIGSPCEQHYNEAKGTMETWVGRTPTGHTLAVFYSGDLHKHVVLTLRPFTFFTEERPDFGLLEVYKRVDFKDFDPLVVACQFNEWLAALQLGAYLQFPIEAPLSMGA